MVISCKECLTRFKVNEALLKMTGSSVKCSLCGTVFTAYPAESKDPAESKQEDEGRFILESKDSTKPAIFKDSVAKKAVEPVVKTAADSRKISRENQVQKNVFLVSLVIILIGIIYSVFVIFGGGNVPYIGGKDTSGDPGSLKITPYAINGRFIENRTVGTMFVITGSAKNGYDMPRSNIRIKGSLFTKEKNLVRDKIVPCGNYIADAELMTLNRSEIEERLEKNLSGQNMSNVDLAPGASVPFMIVFFDLPEDIYNNGEYVVEPYSSIKSKFAQ